MSAEAAYFVVDDVCESLMKEGFAIFYGDPRTATGVRVAERETLREALQYCGRHVTKDETVYRVKLARRHGVHSSRPVARHLM